MVSQPHTRALQLPELLASPLALPSIPKVLATLLAELDRGEPELRTLNRLIGSDPALTTRMLQIANSSFFQLSRRIGSVAEALAVLGFDHVRQLVLAASLATAFRAVPGLALTQFWRYSLNVAKLARALAGPARVGPGTAFTAGLIHAVGELVMHQGMPEAMAELAAQCPPFDLKRVRAERRYLGYGYADVGAAFARAWLFPQPIVDALEHQDTPFETTDDAACEPLAALLHVCAWRARANEARYDARALATSYPGEIALLIGLDIDMVLQQDPIDWTTQGEAHVFM